MHLPHTLLRQDSLAMRAHIDPIPTYILLSAVSAALLLSILSAVVDTAASPRRSRTVQDGEAAPSPPRSKSPSDDSLPQPARPKRAQFCVIFVRVALAASILASMVPSIIIALEYLREGPLSSLASRETNLWMYNVVRRSILDFSQGNNESLVTARVNVGLGDAVLNPLSNGVSRLGWGSVIFIVLIASVVGTVMSVVYELVPHKKLIAAFIYLQAGVWLFGSLTAAFVRPTRLPLDASPLDNKWLDYVYSDNPDFLNETRLLQNWYLQYDTQLSDDDPVRLDTIGNFQPAFCRQFNSLIPTTNADVTTPPPPSVPAPPPPPPSVPAPPPPPTSEPAPPPPPPSVPAPPPPSEPAPPTPTIPAPPPPPPTQPGVDPNDRPTQPSARQSLPSPDSIPVVDLSRSLVSEIFMVYVVGKPIGTDHYRAIAYMALGAIVSAPVAVSQMASSYVLFPFLALWIFILFLFMLIATPTLLRVIRAPVEPNQIITFCERRYRILVTDPTTRLVTILDAITFALILLVAVLRGYKWLRAAEKSAVEENDKEVKLVDYDEVYNKGGSLRW